MTANYAKTFLLIQIPLFLLMNNIAYCKTIKDIDIPEQITEPQSQQTLTLNGAGIRSKFFISVYIGALYLQNKETAITAILQSNQPRRVMMYCLYDEISKQKLIDAWNEGFSKNASHQEFAKLHDRIEQFNELFPALHQGDIVYLDYAPGKGTRLSFNNQVLGVITGEDFNVGLLKIWLGEYPADSDLKAAMMGQE